MTIQHLFIDGTLTDIATLSQSGPGSNGNERFIHIPPNSWTGFSLSDVV